jgi:hypothetical protein
MSSLKQIQANRLNCRRSTGPITPQGKQRSRRNAVRHGLTAETVVSGLEDAKEYESFEAAILADCDPQGALERELVLRLASLLWRLRRALTMETGLLKIQADQMRWSVQKCRSTPSVRPHAQTILRASPVPAMSSDSPPLGMELDPKVDIMSEQQPLEEPDTGVDLARCFLRLANLPNFALDRLSRYETMLSRQVAQVLFALGALRRRP